MRPPSKQDREQFRLSVEWIKAHPAATNHDVPLKFLEIWIQKDLHPPRPDSVAFMTFTVGYVLANPHALQPAENGDAFLHADEALEKYELWQTKLITAKLHHTTSLKSQPLSLFSFSPDERLVVWDEATSAAP